MCMPLKFKNPLQKILQMGVDAFRSLFLKKINIIILCTLSVHLGKITCYSGTLQTLVQSWKFLKAAVTYMPVGQC